MTAPARKNVKLKLVPEKAQPTCDTHADSDAVMCDLIATGGRYGPLLAWADANGLTMRQALFRWHQLRLPVTAPKAAKARRTSYGEG